MESSEVVVEGEFASESQMEEWNLSEQRIEAVKRHCRTQPLKLLRKDTYQNITLYYVERAVKGTMKKASQVQVNQRAHMIVKGGLANIGLAPQPLLGEAADQGDAVDLTRLEEEEVSHCQAHHDACGLGGQIQVRWFE